jgi:multidrug transporter EmrE-like cation transporter
MPSRDLLTSIGLILFSALTGVAGQTVLKIGVTRAGSTPDAGIAFLLTAFRSPFVWLGLAFYGLGALSWILVLSRLPLSVAYPFLALNFVLVALSSRLFLGETIPLLRWGGIGLIVIGILLIARSV